MSSAPAFVPSVVETTFAQSLRHWRHRRAMSQLELSNRSGISQRHISFMESGRAQPSREMVLRLGLVLDVPLRARNLMLLAAGFAPLYRERALTDPELQPVRRALDCMLAQQEPYPAVVVDRLWNLAMANRAAAGLIDWLLGPVGERADEVRASPNLIATMLHARGMRPWIENWPQVASDLLQWIHRESMTEGADGAAARLLEELMAIDGVPPDWRAPAPDARQMPFLPLRLVKDGTRLDLFTTITTLGTPHDVTLHELRVECFFPADDETAAWFRRRA